MKKVENMYSELTLNEAQLPGLKKHEIGGKYRFEIEAELSGIRMQEDWDSLKGVGPMQAGEPPRKPKKKPVASFKIIAIEPLGSVKASAKPARY